MRIETTKIEDIKSGNLTNINDIEKIISLFPNGIAHAIGYGSGVFAQITPSQVNNNNNNQNEKEELPMLDLILAVDDPLTFHSENLHLHPHHYSSLASWLGPNFVSWLQSTNYGAKIYFNPLISVDLPYTNKARSRLIKYGIVNTNDLLQDLKEWQFLYLAGRMQKPTMFIESDDRILEAQYKYNLKYAFAASLLLLGENRNVHNAKAEHYCISTQQLYEQIATLSYSGDPRMSMRGEDPNKIKKLVQSPGQEQRFYELYKDQFNELEQMGILSFSSTKQNIGNSGTTTSSVSWDHNNVKMKEILLSRLPPRLKGIQNLAKLGGAIANIVSPAARGQSLKGILTAGVGRSIKYAGAKFAKGWGLN